MQNNSHRNIDIVNEEATNFHSKQSINQLWFDVSTLLLLPKGYTTGIPRTIRKVLEEWQANPWTKIKYCALHPEHGILEINENYLMNQLGIDTSDKHDDSNFNEIQRHIKPQNEITKKSRMSKLQKISKLFTAYKYGPLPRRKKYDYIPYFIRHNINRIIKRNTGMPQITIVVPKSTEYAYAPFPEGSIKKSVDTPDTKLVLSLGGLWLLNCTTEQFTKIHQDKSIRFVSMIYDLIPVTAPQFSSPNTNFITCTKGMLSSSDMILTISNYSKKEIEQYAKNNCIDAANVEVITLGSDLMNSRKSEKDIVRSPFVLTVGSIEVRKNHYGMYMAWRKLIKKMGRENVPLLVMAGKPGWQGDSIMYLIENDPIVKGKILIFTALNDADITWLYSKCLFTIYASRYEGWGLPVEESFAHGKMCLTTHATSLPEVGKDFADYFDPDCDTALAECIMKAFDSSYRTSREINIRKHFRQNTWRSCASQIQHILEKHYQFQKLGCLPASFKLPVQQNRHATLSLKSAA